MNGVYYQPLGRHPRILSTKAYISWRRGVYRLTAILLGVALVSYLVIHTRLERNRSNFETFSKTNANNNNNKFFSSPTCRMPYLPLDNPEISKFLHHVDPIRCDSDSKVFTGDWVRVNGSHAVVEDEVRRGAPDLSCAFTEIERVDDYRIRYAPVDTLGLVYKFEKSDFVQVRCTGGGERWHSFLACPRPRPPEGQRSMINTSSGGGGHPPLNVLLWGIDSLSRNMFMRTLPKTYEYLISRLQAVVLKGYNIVGDGTPQALIPLLTGQTEQDLPEVRRRMVEAQNVDVYPFLWSDFSAVGYSTAYLEDQSALGTFQYRLKGFKKQPTDYYMRPFYLAADDSLGTYAPNCIGHKPAHQVMMDYFKNILKINAGNPKFIFAFQSLLSHNDNNQIQGEDSDLLKFLQEMETSGVLNSSVLIMFSDHGSRFTNIRETQQGKQEERMPIFTLVFPPWFKKLYHEAFQNVIQNSFLLTTPFDIHYTLRDILRLPKLSRAYYTTPHDLRFRGLSLFRPIPSNRTCRQAAIEAHWCACLQWRTIDTRSIIVHDAALAFVDYVDDLLANHTHDCSPLRLHNVLQASELLPSQELLHFKASSDVDGRLPDLTDKMTVTNSTMQLKIETVPGNARFEVSMTYWVKRNKFKVKESDISRINRYHSDATCLPSTLEHIQKFCYCEKKT